MLGVILMRVARILPSILAAVILLYGFFDSAFNAHATHYVRHRADSVGSLPYGYFQFLRLLACGAASFGAYTLRQRQGWLWTMVIIAVLFNPIAPVRLSRDTWQPIDLATGIAFLASVRALWRSPK